MRIHIIGTGIGLNGLTKAGEQLIAAAELIIGSPRLVESLANGRESVVASRPEEVIAAIEGAETESIAVLVSGDVGFYSGATKVSSWVKQNIPDAELRLIPGVSTVAALAARVGVPWQDAYLMSCHATDVDVVSPVRRHRHTILLTGGNVSAVASSLSEAGYGGLRVWVGQDLGLDSESVVECAIGEVMGQSLSSLTALLIENPASDDRVLSGLPDEQFLRGSVPMTKSVIRAVSLARLGVKPTDICFDIGCGTGSVSVELALAAYSGHVYSVDKNPEAISLTRKNCREFHIGNTTVIEGTAPEAMAGWPAPDVVFIGGTTGSMQSIVDAVVALNASVRIAITTIAIESTSAALDALTSAGLVPQITQVNVSEGKAVGGLHLLTALNPVTIITGGPDG